MSVSQFYAIGNFQANDQQWGYVHRFRIYDGTYTPAELPQLLATAIPDALVSIDVVGGEIVFGGSARYTGVMQGSPTIVAGPTGEMDSILFDGSADQLQLGTAGVDTDASWTVDCYFKTPIPDTGHWHTLTRGLNGDHQVIINPDQTSLGSFDNVGGSGFTDASFDITSLADGWHRLTAAAGLGTVTFYLDGASVGSHDRVSESDVSHPLAAHHDPLGLVSGVLATA